VLASGVLRAVRPAAKRFKGMLGVAGLPPTAEVEISSDLNPWGLPGLLNHPDGFLRHRRLAAAVRAEHGSGTLLNVGDPCCQLHDLLPEFDVTSTDLGEAYLIPPGARFQRADFTDAGAFPEDSFDIVCSTDVFEHIPRPRRRDFIEATLRVARKEAYIAFPAGRDAAAVEELIRCSRSRKTFRDSLENHVVHGLPQPGEVEELLKELGCNYSIRPLTTVVEWLTSFVMCPEDYERPELVMGYWSFLDRTAADVPGPGPIYRYLVVVGN
jgi:hypothetical protein